MLRILMLLVVTATVLPGSSCVSAGSALNATQANLSVLGSIVILKDGRISVYSLDAKKTVDNPWPMLVDRDVRTLAAATSGRAIAVTYETDSHNDVIVYDLVRKRKHRIVLRHPSISASAWDPEGEMLSVLSSDLSLTVYRVTDQSVDMIAATTLPSQAELLGHPNEISCTTEGVGVVNRESAYWFDLAKQEWSETTKPKATRMIQIVGNNMFYLIGLQRLYSSAISGSKGRLVHDANVAYAYAHGCWVRSDGRYVLYDRPSSRFWKSGYEWVLVNLSDSTHYVIEGSARERNQLRYVVAWIFPDKESWSQ